MNHSTPSLSKADRERFDLLRGVGCIACITDGLEGLRCGNVEIHHLLSGNKRRGHRFTIPLGAWHHRAIVNGSMSRFEMEQLFGPSLANGSKPFHARYGADNDLLVFADTLIGIEVAA